MLMKARSRSLSKVQSLLAATGTVHVTVMNKGFRTDTKTLHIIKSAGNVIGLSVGGAIAMESGMKTVEQKLQGSGSELLYLMDRYS